LDFPVAYIRVQEVHFEVKFKMRVYTIAIPLSTILELIELSSFMDFDGAPIEMEDLNSTHCTSTYLKFKQTLNMEDCDVYKAKLFSKTPQ